MIENFETNQIVVYLPGGYLMHLETTWNKFWSSFNPFVPLFNHFQTVKAGELKFSQNVHHTLYSVMCFLPHVPCLMSRVTCHMSRFGFKKKEKSYGASLWRVCYQFGLPRQFLKTWCRRSCSTITSPFIN